MTAKVERFFNFLQREKCKGFLACAFYVSIIGMVLEIAMPLPLEIICTILRLIVALLWYVVSMMEVTDEHLEKKSKKERLKQLVKEIVMFIPVLIVSNCIIYLVAVGKPVNQMSIETSIGQAPIYYSISAIIVGPIVEEYIFRFLPHKFIKNPIIYVIFSTFVFATMHVVDDPNAYYYIWFYMMRPLYYAYRYHKTQDLAVPICMHSLNNLVATLPLIIK
ncbi:MAG: CPBP family intramembrane metalloprotease [Clostridia bacterium]|nr:CPBP family intramembrane metalloprotease [Clostridia bacterium]